MADERTRRTPADLEAQRKRLRVYYYEVGARVGLSPYRLAQMMKGRLPMTAEMAERLADVLDAWHGEAASSA